MPELGSTKACALPCIKSQSADNKETLKAIGYFENNESRMLYGTFRDKGYSIGSGVVEDDSFAFLQTLFGFARKRNAFRLPEGVSRKHPAFGRVPDTLLARKRGVPVFSNLIPQKRGTPGLSWKGCARSLLRPRHRRLFALSVVAVPRSFLRPFPAR